MENFTDSLFEGLTENNAERLADVPGATKLLNDVVSRISYILYNDFNRLRILPEDGRIIDGVWECALTFDSYEDLPAAKAYLDRANNYLINFYKNHDYSQIIPAADAMLNADGAYTKWRLVANASEKAKKQFNNVENFIADKEAYLRKLLARLENCDKVQVTLFTNTPTTYLKDEFNLEIAIKIDLTAFDEPLDICQDLDTDDTKAIAAYFIKNQGKYFLTSGILNYINKFVERNYGSYFKNGLSLFQYLNNALNQEADLVKANPNKVFPFKADGLGKLLPRKLVTGDPDLKLALNGDILTADAKIYGENAESRFITNHASDYLFAVLQGEDPHWAVYRKADNYAIEYAPAEVGLFVNNRLVFPNITLIKFKSESSKMINADKITDEQLPKFVRVSIETLFIGQGL